MSTVELKKQLVKKIQSIDDESLLKKVYSILEKRPRRSKPLKPMTLKEFRARITQSQKDIKEGRVYSTQEVLKKLGIKKK